MRIHDVPTNVLDMAAFAEQVDERRAMLDAIALPGIWLVEFEVVGAWFGSCWRRTRHFRWMLYVALQDADGQWIDYHEDLVRRRGRRGRRDTWALLQPPERALEAVERFARERLTGSTR